MSKETSRIQVSRKTVHGAFSRLRARLGGSDLAQKDALPLSGDGLPHRGPANAGRD
jgi:hypothetical protein